MNNLEFSQEINNIIEKICKKHNVIFRDGIGYWEVFNNKQTIMDNNNLQDLIQETNEQFILIRTVLDHIVFQIAKENRLSVKNRRIAFPIYSESKKEFHKFMNSHLTGLRSINPQIYSILESIQYYNGSSWVLFLKEISNISKHNYFEKLEYRDIKLVKIGTLEKSLVLEDELNIEKDSIVDTTNTTSGILVKKINLIDNGKIKTKNKIYTAPMTITIDNVKNLNDPTLDVVIAKILYLKTQNRSFMSSTELVFEGFSKFIISLQQST